MRSLLEAGVHFGHRSRFWNPKMAPYIYGTRKQIHVINLEKTLPMLNDAMNVLGDIASKKGKILFVGTKNAASAAVKEAAGECGMPYVNHRWLGGTLTNYKTIRRSVTRLKELETLTASSHEGRMTKKEFLNLERDKERLERSVGGIRDLNGMPDAMFIIDVGHERIALQEARHCGIPVLGIADTNINPEVLDYIIPGNDDSRAAIRLYCNAASEAIQNGRLSALQGSIQEEETEEQEG